MISINPKLGFKKMKLASIKCDLSVQYNLEPVLSQLVWLVTFNVIPIFFCLDVLHHPFHRIVIPPY